MNNPNDDHESLADLELRVYPRASETVSIQIPKDTLQSLEKVATQREMSVEALLRLYVGKGLRQDLSQLFANQLLVSTEKVLAKYYHSVDEIAKIMQEIRSEAR